MNAEMATTKPAKVRTPQWLADALDTHGSTVRRACADGRIRAIRVGTSWRIPNDEAERVIAEGIPSAAA